MSLANRPTTEEEEAQLDRRKPDMDPRPVGLALLLSGVAA